MKPATLLRLVEMAPLISKLLLITEAVSPIIAMTLALLGVISADFALASLSVSFALALVAGILQCWRKKIGWSKQTCVMTGFGLFSMSILFYYTAFRYGSPLLLIATTTMLNAAMWFILLAQAFKYEKYKLKFETGSVMDQVVGGNKDALKNMDALKTITQNPEVMNSLQGLLGQLMGKKDSEEDSDDE